MTAYEGNKPYIFVSYAHKDTDRVLPIIEALAAAGFRVWYDAGIEAGSEWPEYIATHLEHAACVIAFLSEASIASKNCRQEINYAIDLDIPTLTVYLEDLTLTGGMRMRVGLLQALFYHRYETSEAFYGALFRTDLLLPCHSSYTNETVPDKTTPSSDGIVTSDKNKKTPKKGGVGNVDTVVDMTTGLKKKSEEPALLTQKTNEFTIENGELRRCHSQSANIIVPDGVTVIGSEAFKDHVNLRRVRVPDGITLIRSWAFAGCTNLTEIELPESIKLISSHTFPYSGLKSITIPEGVTAIGREAFKNCERLESVSLPSTLTEISTEAFRNCKALTTITLPASVKTVGEWAFAGCNKLKTVYLSSKTAYATDSKKSFLASSKLIYTDGGTPITTPTTPKTASTKKSTTKTAAKKEDHFVMENGVLIRYEGTGGAVTIPDGVKEIGSEAFGHCSTLTAVTIPASVLRIGDGAFKDCTALTTAYGFSF
ncbi:MAG: leucine-rich repeat protein [Clostridia bacterium]|nr:leucine-rich repeat protein [Clostridia bacterium]